MAKFLILSIITSIFVLTGIVLPIVNSEYGIEDADDYSGATDVLNEMEDANVLSLGSVTLSIISIFFYSFGALPLFLEAFYFILRIIFWFIVVDILWLG